MKNILLTVLFTLFITATSYALESKYCVQEISDAEYDISAVHYVVQIDETKDITKEFRKIRSVDTAFEVNVRVSLAHEYGKFAGEVKNFSAIATSEDVYYTISSVKKNGFKFYVYLDETDQAGMTIYNNDGSEEKIRLVCN